MTFNDALAVLQALLVCPLVFLIPGLLLGKMANVFSFATGSISMRVAIGLLLSLSAWPIVVYLLGRWLGLKSVAALDILMLAAVLGWAVRSGKNFATCLHQLFAEIGQHKLSYAIAVLWLIIGAALLLDAQVGDCLYTSAAIYDYCKHVAVSDAICRTGIPPDNPLFCPAVPVKLFYYYFWSMLCSLVATICQAKVIDTTPATIAACLWTGLGLLAAIPIVLHEIYDGDSNVRKRVEQAALSLVWVAGLDVVPVLLIGLYYESGLKVQALAECPPSVVWWCRPYIIQWLTTMLWVPQHLAGFIAGLTGSLLLRRSLLPGESRSNVIISAFCFASCCGLSVYLAMTWAIFWALVALVCCFKRKKSALVCLMASAVVTAVLSSSFVFELLAANARHGNLIGFHLPMVSIAGVEQTKFWRLLGVAGDARAFASLAISPLRWMIGFGLFGFTTLLYWSGRFSTREDRFLLVLVGVSLSISTFLHAEVHFDDLSTRSLLPAQFVFLLWTARYLAIAPQRSVRPALSGLLAVLLAAGVLTTICDCYLQRTFAVFSRFVSPGPRVLALRDAYSRLNQLLPAAARTQHNPLLPDFLDVEPYSTVYGHHQVVVSDPHRGPLMGVDESKYAAVTMEVGSMFYGLTSAAEAEDICHRWGIDCVVVTDWDPIWRMARSWLRGRQPVVANEHVRAYFVSDGGALRRR